MADGPSNYASPLMRKAVHDRLHPGAFFEYERLPIADSDIPAAYRNSEGPNIPEPSHVVRCTIIYPDGSWVSADREIDLVQKLKGGGTRPIPSTPEAYFSAETKALGRALSRAGIPHQLTELQSLMRWAVALGDQPAPAAPPAPVAPPTPREREDTPPPIIGLIARLDGLDGPIKAAVTRTAREAHGLTNIAGLRDPGDIAIVHEIINQIEKGTP